MKFIDYDKSDVEIPLDLKPCFKMESKIVAPTSFLAHIVSTRLDRLRQYPTVIVEVDVTPVLLLIPKTVHCRTAREVHSEIFSVVEAFEEFAWWTDKEDFGSYIHRGWVAEEGTVYVRNGIQFKYVGHRSKKGAYLDLARSSPEDFYGCHFIAKELRRNSYHCFTML